MKKYIPIAVGAVLIALGAVWYLGRVEVVVLEGVTTKEGNFSIAKAQKIVLKNGGSLVVNGHLTIDGEVSCENGAVTLSATKGMTVNGSIRCMRVEGTSDAVALGISLVASGGVTFSSSANIASNGHVQVVSDSQKLKNTQKDIDTLYDEIGLDVGTGTRFGPFVESGATQNVKVSLVPEPRATQNISSSWIQRASAQTPRDNDGNIIENTIISGNWHIGDGSALPGGIDIPKPPKGVKKIVLHFDLGSNGSIEIKDFYMSGPSGRDGENDTGAKCIARGAKGENAFRMRVNASDISLNNVTVALGNGGEGGDAETLKDCDPGVATGGDGGEAGNLKMTATGKISIASFRITPGVGGIGGDATAYGKDGVDGCPGSKGGEARAVGGKGGDNKKELAASGAVEGIKNITIDRIDGGWGGQATAQPGKGGNGTSCSCAGGKGGDATATGGIGGNASAKIIGGTAETHGGTGGDADATAGNGGNGGSCPLKPKGGNGGNGGSATTKSGKGGKGMSSDGTDGRVLAEQGGNGGNGGDGCGPGNGGNGGAPNGVGGKVGERQCPEEKKTNILVTPPHNTTPTPSGTTPPKTENKIKVIEYQGKYLPIDQLIIENEIGCGADHWHAARGVVKATDGSFVQDPGPQCGYGKVKDKLQIEV